jgi:hypothetical protein
MKFVQNLSSHFLNWRNWELNPIVVKEMRQAVRSWAVVGAIHLFLLALLLTAAVMLLTSTFSLNPNQMLGRDLFYAFLGILTVGSLFVPVYVGIRLAAERQGENLDLIYITTLSPGRIVRGKMFCGAVISTLFFSACLPFMFLTTFLRGVDLPTIVVVMAFVFLIVNASVQVTIFLACLKMSKGLKILIALPVLFMGLMLLAPVTMMSQEIVNSGVGNLLGSWTFWGPVLTAIFSIGLGLGLLHLLSIALITPPSANRALPLRIYITAIWLLDLAIFLIWIYLENAPEMMIGWTISSILLLTFTMVVSVSERGVPGVRVRMKIPQNILLRPLAFLFYSGAAGGTLWACLLILLTALGNAIWNQFTTRQFPGMDMLSYLEQTIRSSGVAMYIIAYALTGLFVRRKFFPRVNPIIGGLTMLLIPALWAIVPNVVLFFMDRLNQLDSRSVQLGDILNLLYTRSKTGPLDHLMFASVWAAVMFFANLPWFLKSFRDFQPYRTPSAGEDNLAEAIAVPNPSEKP